MRNAITIVAQSLAWVFREKRPTQVTVQLHKEFALIREDIQSAFYKMKPVSDSKIFPWTVDAII